VKSLAFFQGKYVVMGFKDQSLKLLEVEALFNLDDQPKKKVKKSLHGNNKSEMVS
jgi:hypothetical protein